MSRETKRLLKQKSQESFKDNNKSVTSIPYIDASPPSSNGLGGLSCSKASFVSSPNHKGKCTSCRLHKTIEWNGRCLRTTNNTDPRKMNFGFFLPKSACCLKYLQEIQGKIQFCEIG